MSEHSASATSLQPHVVRLVGSFCSLAYAGFIVWLYVQQPQTLAEVTGGVAAAVGAYAIDEASFQEGLRFFRNDQFREARAAFMRADSAQRDATTQFYIAYTYYREGWGRLHHDDELFREGIVAVDRAVRLAPNGRLRVDDPNLAMRTGDELRAELERGLAVEASDFNPLRVFRKRK